MDGVLLQSQITAMNKVGNVVLDIESLTQQPDRCCSGSPKMTKALSRKGSSRMERRAVEEQETDDASKKIVVKVMPSQLEQLKQPLVPNKTLLSVASTANSPVLADLGEGRNKRFSRLTTIHPRKILLFFATMVFCRCVAGFWSAGPSTCDSQSKKDPPMVMAPVVVTFQVQHGVHDSDILHTYH